MKTRLIVLMLLALLLCAPTVREETRAAEAPKIKAAEIAAPAPEITPKPPAVNKDGPKVQAHYFEICEEIPAEEPEPEPEAPTIWRADVPLSAELQTVLLTICEEAGVDPLLALGLIQTESNFQTDAVSKSGDYGLCQLNYNYFDPCMTPEENLRAGIGYLGSLLEKHRTTEAALTAYHVGHDDGTRYYAGVVLGHAAAWGYGA